MERYIPLGRLACGFGALAFIGYQAWDLLLDPQALERTGPIRLLTVFHFILCIGFTYLPFAHKHPRYWPFFMIYIYVGYVVFLAFILAQLPGGFIAGVGGFILGMIFMPAVTNGVLQAASVLIPQIVSTLLAISLLGGSSFEVINVLAWIGGGAAFTIGFAYLLDVINRRSFQLELMLETEKQRSDSLLLNILPLEIAERLKAKQGLIADTHDYVSVLFADISGFTKLSREVSATELVKLLNDLFSRFDQLTLKHDAEKIKTIGDAYMVATGLSGAISDHVDNIANLALEMRVAFEEFRRQNKVNLGLRIGVHSGSAIAGVIGEQKFSYDLWGDTVNVASRMESEGIPGKIQISAETRGMLSDRYQTSFRGEIPIKGHSHRPVYTLDSIKADTPSTTRPSMLNSLL